MMPHSQLWQLFWGFEGFVGVMFTIFLIGAVLLKKTDKMAFKRYQRKKHKELMNYAHSSINDRPVEKPIVSESNSIEKPNFFIEEIEINYN